MEQFSHDRPPSQQTNEGTGQSTPARPSNVQAEAESFAAGLRKRGWLGGDGAATPDAAAAKVEPAYPPAAVGDSSMSSAGDETVAPSPLLYGTPQRKSSGSESDTTLDSQASAEHEGAGPRASYAPSFLPTKLEFTDSRALDFRNYIRVWFISERGRNPKFSEIYRKDMADWVGWSLYGVPLEELEAEREEWIRKGKPEQKINGEPDLDEEGLEIEKDKLGLVEHVSKERFGWLGECR